MPLSEATERAMTAVSMSGVAAVPVFSYESKWCSGLKAWVACPSPDIADEIFDSLLTGCLARFHQAAIIDLAITDSAPRSPSLWDAALFFCGKVVEDFGLTRRIVPNARAMLLEDTA
jgi:hypothetical protein